MQSKLQGRLILLNTYLTIKYIPFNISDWLSFGYVSDMLKLYDIPRLTGTENIKFVESYLRQWYRIHSFIFKHGLENYIPNKQSKKLINFNRMINKFINTEIYIYKSFYQKYIAPIDTDKLLETYWKFLHDYVIILEHRELLIDWCKREERRYEIENCYRLLHGSDISHAQWLDFYLNFKIDWV